MKVPKPRKLKSGTWFIQLRLNGESISVTALTQNECVKKAEYVKAEYRNGLKKHSKSELTLNDAINQYIENRSNILSPSTIRGYRIIQRNRFKSVSNTPLAKINNWQHLVNQEAQKCTPKTVKNAFGFISSVLKENDIPIPNVSMPKPIRKEKKFLNPDEIKVLMQAVEDTEIEIAVLLGLHSLRRSELLALTKEKVVGGVIKVNSTVVPDENNVMIEKPYAKTAKSNREITIQIPRLMELIDRSEGGRLVQLHQDTLRKRIDSVCRQHQLPEVGIHGLRHSFASLAFYLGISETVTMAIGGWEDYQTVHRVYKHLAEKEKINAEKQLSNFFSS